MCLLVTRNKFFVCFEVNDNENILTGFLPGCHMGGLFARKTKVLKEEFLTMSSDLYCRVGKAE